MKLASFEEIIHIHEVSTDVYGGIDGIRDENQVYSAIATPNQTWGGYDLYPSLEEKIARMAFVIIKNHPFNDGNKRTGYGSILYNLKLNDIDFAVDKANDHKFIESVASGESSYEDLVEFIKNIQI